MKEKNKGFTLVELLAVIVILAIIALIATPIILNVINDAKKEAAKDSFYGYMDAIEKAIIANDVEEEEDFPTPDSNGCYNLKELNKKVNLKGTQPKINDNAKVCLKEGTITSLTGVEVDDFTFNYEDKKLTQTKSGTTDDTKNYKFYENGTAIYYNPETGKKCSEEEAVSKTGTKSGCMKWYVFNDKEGNATVNVILDHNTTAKVAWNLTKSNSEMKEVKTALENDTSTWKNTARLIEANEIAKITGHPTFDASKENQDWFYLDSNNQTKTANSTNKSKYAWLFDYTYECTDYGCNISISNSTTNGYWTSTPYKDSSTDAWIVSGRGYLCTYFVAYTAAADGVRPVITISKSNIS